MNFKMNISYVLVFFQFFSLIILFVPVHSYENTFTLTSSLLSLSLSLMLLWWTSRHNKVGNFNIIPEIKEGSSLIQTGPYHYIRHPMYASVVLIGLAALIYNFAYFKIGVLMFLIFILVLKAQREERFWCKENEEYKGFILKTKMFIPFVL